MISRIKIENYKSIRNLDFEMKPINILIGANGVGKSNFINFFNFLKQIHDQKLQLHVAEEGGSDNILHFGSKESEHLVGLVTFDNKNGYYFKLRPSKDNKLYFEYEGSDFNKEFYGKKDRSTNVDWLTNVWSKGNFESSLIEQKSTINIYVSEYMNSFKVFHFHDTSKTSKMRKAAQINDNSFFREDASNLSAYLYWMQEKHPLNFKKIERVVNSVAPFFEKFNLQPDRLNPDMIRLEWQEKGSEYFNAMHLSDGTLRFIALATLLLQPEAPQIIIIDEPELGLHPFAINKLAGLIQKASANSQVIISTQSVNLVDNFVPEDIITVDRKDGQSVFKRLSSEELKEWLSEYNISDLWNKNVIGGRP